MRWTVRPGRIAGTARVPGDKSLAHRALLFAALAQGTSHLRHLPLGEDVLSTARCLRTLGVPLEADGDETVVRGGALRPPTASLDAGNSGTTTRLLAGILAGQPFDSCLDGDASLRARPMDRIIRPLEAMGGQLEGTAGRVPLRIFGRRLSGIEYELPVASAQVKSAVLLAGLTAEGQTVVRERHASRDHTERMLQAMGAPLEREGLVTRVEAGPLRPLDFTVPGDLSSAAFLITAALLTGGAVTIPDVGLNPTRTGFLRVIERMGVQVTVADERLEAGEPVGTLRVAGAVEWPIEVGAGEVPQLIDELPLVALLATQAPGRSRVSGAGELRVKETDRIAAISRGLGRLGACVRELPDGFTVDGGARLRGAPVSSEGDHRQAMMLAVAGLVAKGETEVEGAEASAVSYPEFAATLVSLGAELVG